MKRQLITAGVAAAAAAGALGLALPAPQHAQHHDVALVDFGDPNLYLLELEGVTNPPATLPDSPLGTEAEGNFYDVVTSGTTTSGSFVVTDSTPAAQDLLNSSLVTGDNQAVGIGDTNGYIGLSPTATPGDFAFNDVEGVDFDHGVQALLTALNQPYISLEVLVNDFSSSPVFDPAELNLDPADLGTNVATLTTLGDLTAAFSDFTAAATAAGF
jgi:hypothetical protein